MSLRAPISYSAHRGHRIKTAPLVEPVSAAELRGHLRLDDTSEDTYLGTLISEARQFIEDMSGLALIDQTWTLTLDTWPHAERNKWWDGVEQGHISQLQGQALAVALPRYPLSSISSVKVYDEESNETTVTVATSFDVDTDSMPGRLALQSGATWPAALRPTNAIKIEYVAGFGTAATNVPAALKRAVRILAAYMYEHRGDCDNGNAMVDSGAQALVDSYRVVRV